MSSITSVQDFQEVNSINSTQDLQKSTSLHGRAFHKITEGGKYIIQSINNIAQSVLSTCIRVVSFGRYNLDSLKSYLFSNQTALKGDETTIPSNLPLRSAPPPPPPSAPPPPPRMPTQEDLNEASSSRFSSAKASVRSFNPTQDSPEEDDNLLEDGIRSRRSSLHEDSIPVIEEESNANPNVSPPKKKKGLQRKLDQGKQVVEGLFAGVQDSPLFQKIKNRVNQ